MPPEFDERQRRAVGVIIDCCSDIREIYACRELRKAKKKLSEVEELAQEEDTKAMDLLERDLLDYLDTSQVLGLEWDFLEAIIEQVLPPEVFEEVTSAVPVK